MRKLFILLITLFLAAAILPAQVTGGTIQAIGSATINVTPDQAQLTVSVVTQATTAQDAAQQNATLANAVIAALKSMLGSLGTVQTVGYSVNPRYTNTSPQTIIGYTATNSVQVTTYDLSNIGRLIDTANQAGANSVSGVSFGLRNPDPVTQQALGQAAKQALVFAASIAAGLGTKVGPVISAQQGASYTPVDVPGALAAAATTPIQSGTVGVSATVTVVVQQTQ